jgi:Fungal fucose-specific lectin
MSDNPNMPIGTATISWVDSGGNTHIRVYSTDGYNVSERCADNGSATWTNGSFSAPGSAVSATAFQANGVLHIRIYCTFEDGTTEWCSDSDNSNGWYKGAYTVS